MASDYSVLGLAENSSEDDVTKQYRRLAMKYHPDRNNGTTTEKFIEIKSAYERIISGNSIRETKKKEYDESVRRSIMRYEENSVKRCVSQLLSTRPFDDDYEICLGVYRRFNDENMYLKEKELIAFAYKCYLESVKHPKFRTVATFIRNKFNAVFRKNPNKGD